MEGGRGDKEASGEVFEVGAEGVERSTLGYMVREELQREKLRGRAGMRAWGSVGI